MTLNSIDLLTQDHCTITIFTGAPTWASVAAAATTPGALANVADPTWGAGVSLPTSSQPAFPEWRVLPLVPGEIPLSDATGEHSRLLDNGGYFAITDATRQVLAASFDRSFDSERDSESGVEAASQLLSQFCEHSLVHNDVRPEVLSQLSASTDLQSSQNACSHENEAQESDDSYVVADSFQQPDKPPTSNPDVARDPPGPLTTALISDIRDIPTRAAQLRTFCAPTPAISNPRQTVPPIVSLIAGIISLQPARAIQTRWGSTVHLVEVLVGDDTRSGLAVSFWYASAAAAAGMLARFRRQDVVLLQNVGLAAYAGRVYGQSLRPSASVEGRAWGKSPTQVYLLYRRRLDAQDVHGIPAHYNYADIAVAGGGIKDAVIHNQTTGAVDQLEKTRRVWAWVLRFVTGVSGDPRRSPIEIPPDDSQ